MPYSTLSASGSIDIRTLENASQATYGSDPAALGLQPVIGPDGRAGVIDTADGCTGDVYLDAAGNVVIAYQGTTTAQQEALDGAILDGTPAARLPAFAEAVAFAQGVQADAMADGIAASRIYVTGFSLGGTLAEYVASQTGLAGAGLAGFGLPGYVGPGTPSGFVSFVGRGDPYANAATDTAEAAQARLVVTHGDHYGEVALVGTQQDSRTLMTFISALDATGLDLRTSLFEAVDAVRPQFDAAVANHVLAKYDADIATRYGDATLAQIAALEAPSAVAGSAGSMAAATSAASAASAETGVSTAGAAAGLAAALPTPAATSILYHPS